MKKKDKEIIQKPDMFHALFTSTIQFIRTNSKLCIVGLVVLIVAIAAGYAYMLHLNSQYDKIQYQLSQGIQSFNEYNTSGKQEDIDKAEGIFNGVAQKKKRQSQYIAKLYLAKINYMRGKNEDAKKIYQEILKGTSNSTLKALSEKAIQHIDKNKS
jgi:predicted negative regulator of RcsB-dependent stress response